MWQVRGKFLGLRGAVEESRSIRFKSRQQRILREYARLCGRLMELLVDARIANQMNDSSAKQRLASEIATFHQEFGAFEGRLDSMLLEPGQPSVP